jgi:hypothetical protein
MFRHLPLFILNRFAFIPECYDSNNATEVDSFTVDLVVGWNDVKVQKDYPYFKIFVGYDATNNESVYMPLNTSLNGAGWYDLYFAWGNPISPYQGILRGAQSDKPYSNLQEGGNLYGMTGRVSVTCAYDSILCANKKIFTTVLWYLLGVELLTERIYSDRLNRYTTIDLKRATDLRKELEEKFMEEMQATFDGIELTTWDGCLTCSAQVRLEHALP